MYSDFVDLFINAGISQEYKGRERWDSLRSQLLAASAIDFSFMHGLVIFLPRSVEKKGNRRRMFSSYYESIKVVKNRYYYFLLLL